MVICRDENQKIKIKKEREKNWRKKKKKKVEAENTDNFPKKYYEEKKKMVVLVEFASTFSARTKIVLFVEGSFGDLPC